MASPAPILHQLNNVRLQEAKALLKPFDELPQSCQRKILAWKSGWHSDTSDTLRQHLEYLNLLELSDFLMWIPFERFLNVRLLCKGGFATIWAANDYIGGRTFVLKEMSMELLQELVLTAIVSSRTDSSELGLSLVGLSKYDVQYLMVMEYASGAERPKIDSVVNTLWDMVVKFKPDTQLGILNPLIAKFRKRFRNQLMPGTRMYVMQRMAAYEANLAAGNLSSGFEFFDQPGSFRSKLTSPSRSQYYTREQLINYTRQLTISEGPDRPTNVCGRHNLTDFVDLFHHQY
ncbi:hypothetical protein BC938DRAFT_476434 [Jimgerdemannia flammicorona]|uniref:Protein kinase domain-containing protein n=1 Tax=Jimgerdemannia flammicorona TaxID=994334 RepID=A0A433QQJ9_9FUNG|nr:hypothetical protein BC938DRAFT_476434 [Jimgerdemannia flammicorona]